jgi:hypothetical protein
MLKSSRWALAWVTGSAIEQIGDDERQDMPRMNRWFAQIKLADGRFHADAVRELRGYRPRSEKPRYEILKKSILREFDDIEPFLDRALEDSDLTINELEEWPALEFLRSNPVFRRWYESRTS